MIDCIFVRQYLYALVLNVVLVPWIRGDQESIIQKSPVFLFDLHGVLMKINKKELLATSFREFCKDPRIICSIGNVIRGDVVHSPALRRIYNCHKPVPEVFQLVQQLRRQGHAVYLFSNINETTFQELKDKFPPDLFSVFSGWHVVPDVDNSRKKPNKGSYMSCKERLAKDGHAEEKCRYIFIDDSKENTAAAKEYGFEPIYYESPTQLKRDLFLRGYYEKSSP